MLEISGVYGTREDYDTSKEKEEMIGVSHLIMKANCDNFRQSLIQVAMKRVKVKGVIETIYEFTPEKGQYFFTVR